MKTNEIVLLILFSNICSIVVIYSIFNSKSFTLILDLNEIVQVGGNTPCTNPHQPLIDSIPEFDSATHKNSNIHLTNFLDRRRRGHLDNTPLYFLQDHLTIVDPPNQICQEFDNEDLVIVVSSPCASVDRREAIRMTWGSTANEHGVPVVFFVGTDVDRYCSKVTEELMTYGDVIVGNFVDSYSNLTLKTVSIVNWVRQRCPQKFLLRTDDDVVLNVSNILRYIYNERATISGALTGVLRSNRSVVRSEESTSQWYVPKLLYPSSKYPDYLLGSGYLISTDLLDDLYYASLMTPYLHIQDVFLTGIVARALELKVIDERRFYCPFSEADYCTFQKIFLKRVAKGDQLLQVWEMVNKPSDCKLFNEALKVNRDMPSYFNSSESSNLLMGDVSFDEDW